MHSFSDLLKSLESLKMLTSLENKELGAFAPSVNPWLRGEDLNLWPPGYEPDELPTAPPRDVKLVDGVGFEPTKRNAADLQSAPFNHSGTHP